MVTAVDSVVASLYSSSAAEEELLTGWITFWTCTTFIALIISLSITIYLTIFSVVSIFDLSLYSQTVIMHSLLAG